MPTRRSVLKKTGHLCAALAAGGVGSAFAAEQDGEPAAQKFLFTNPKLTAETMAWATKILVV